MASTSAQSIFILLWNRQNFNLLCDNCSLRKIKLLTTNLLLYDFILYLWIDTNKTVIQIVKFDTHLHSGCCSDVVNSTCKQTQLSCGYGLLHTEPKEKLLNYSSGRILMLCCNVMTWSLNEIVTVTISHVAFNRLYRQVILCNCANGSFQDSKLRNLVHILCWYEQIWSWLEKCFCM